jgi:hypothetical protein
VRRAGSFGPWCTQVSEPTYAVIVREGELPPNEMGFELELMTLETALENARWAAKEHGRRYTVYKLTETATFPGRPK